MKVTNVFLCTHERHHDRKSIRFQTRIELVFIELELELYTAPTQLEHQSICTCASWQCSLALI